MKTVSWALGDSGLSFEARTLLNLVVPHLRGKILFRGEFRCSETGRVAVILNDGEEFVLCRYSQDIRCYEPGVCYRALEGITRCRRLWKEES
jgi:hypothetical protein